MVTIFGGALYFQELSSFGVVQSIMFSVGVLVTLAGIVLLSQRQAKQCQLLVPHGLAADTCHHSRCCVVCLLACLASLHAPAPRGRLRTAVHAVRFVIRVRRAACKTKSHRSLAKAATLSPARAVNGAGAPHVAPFASAHQQRDAKGAWFGRVDRVCAGLVDLRGACVCSVAAGVACPRASRARPTLYAISHSAQHRTRLGAVGVRSASTASRTAAR